MAMYMFVLWASNNATANMKLLKSDPNILGTKGSEMEKKRKYKNETTNQMNKTNKWQQQQNIMARVNLTQTANKYWRKSRLTTIPDSGHSVLIWWKCIIMYNK